MNLLTNMSVPVANGLPDWKRGLDLLLILLALPLLLPLAAVIALGIRLASPGPVLFQQERIGYLEKRFTCLKFRTMFTDAKNLSHEGHLQQLIHSNLPMQKLDVAGDARITPYGRLLRVTGLDELPQLINILKGEMSLVGPRPCLPYESAKYLPWQKERFNVLPGLTGLWQVSGKNRTTFIKMIQLDITYARQKNLGLDILIILKTIPALIVQMWDMRTKIKPASNMAMRETILPAKAENQ